MKSFTLKSATTGIELVEWGNPNGVPILMLHGWLDNAFSFKPLSEAFSSNKFRLIAMDLPGHGLSGHRPTGCLYNYLDFLCDIHSVVKSLGWSKFNLLGHSMGGGLSSLYAGTFPDSIENLILIEALGPVTREANDAPEFMGTAIQRYLDHWNSFEDSFFRDREQLVRLRLRAGEMKEESARLLIERGTEEVELGIRLRRDLRLTLPSLIRLTEVQLLEFLKRISAPTTLILGENGYKWEKSLLENRKSAIKNLQEIILPGNHHLHMDQPELVGEVIERVLFNS